MIDLPKLLRPKTDPAPGWFHIAVAVSMIIGAGASLVAAFKTSQSMSALVDQNARLVRAQSAPALVISAAQTDDAARFEIRNVGNGLARIVWMELKHDGKVVSDLKTFLESVSYEVSKDMDAKNKEEGRPIRFSEIKGQIFNAKVAPSALRIIERGQTFTLIDIAPRLGDHSKEALISSLRKHALALDAEACYCSLVDECWVSTLRAEVAKPVKTCDPSGRVNFGELAKK
jgi:hypothetical protein